MADLKSEAIARASGSNFISSFWFLPKEKRRAMNVIYAFCRLTDDIVDLAEERGAGAESARLELAAWREDMLHSLKGNFKEKTPQVLRELSQVAGKYRIEEKCFTGLIEGCRMDIEKKSYANFEELYQYCYRVASLVGLMCLGVFEAKEPKSRDFAVDLGIAFQLTNILRDIRQDAGRGRVYIPEDDLTRFGFSRREFMGLAVSGPGENGDLDKFERLMEFETARAKDYYQKARENLPGADRAGLAAAEVMASVYGAILGKIRSEPSRVLKGKVGLPRWFSLLKVFQGWAANRLRL
ncbi:MAG: hypothetical protein A3A86_06060 [Elusimicrobia bacterium RIFCSPLOWO2_01_FULL_60_11]|nr:MAG: hypothetical protein A3A86_06060 [Elusimicrobia bacterium RIFCSPLOWO2_01_FULL_60_11]